MRADTRNQEERYLNGQYSRMWHTRKERRERDSAAAAAVQAAQAAAERDSGAYAQAAMRRGAGRSAASTRPGRAGS